MGGLVSGIGGVVGVLFGVRLASLGQRSHRCLRLGGSWAGGSLEKLC